MAKTYECIIDVRGYELDSFGHVNHAVYISYLEHARWEQLREAGVGLAEFKEWQRWPVISKLEVAYLKPTYMSDRLIVRTDLNSYSRTSFTLDQKIYRASAPAGSAAQETLVFEAKIVIVMVNERGRPADMPDQVREMFN